MPGMTATLTFLYDLGVVTVEMVCEHGTFTSSLLVDPVVSAAETDGIAALADVVRVGHHREFGCECEITTIINGEMPLP